MPGLKQAYKIAKDKLREYLLKYGYAPVAQTLALLRHLTNNLTFILCVEDFGIKYIHKHELQDLLNTLQDL